MPPTRGDTSSRSDKTPIQGFLDIHLSIVVAVICLKRRGEKFSCPLAVKKKSRTLSVHALYINFDKNNDREKVTSFFFIDEMSESELLTDVFW